MGLSEISNITTGLLKIFDIVRIELISSKTKLSIFQIFLMKDMYKVVFKDIIVGGVHVNYRLHVRHHTVPVTVET